MSKVTTSPSVYYPIFFNRFNYFYILGIDYVNNYNGIKAFVDAISDTNLVNNILKNSLFTNASDYVIGLQLYPISDLRALLSNDATQSRHDIILGTTQPWGQGYLANKGNAYATDLNSKAIFDMGSVTINKHYNNFLDYEKFTDIQLYLPYVGLVPLDVNVVMGKTISIKYVLNWITGTFTYNIECDSAIIMTGDGKMSITIPIGQTNGQDVARNKLALSMQAITTAMSMGMTSNSSYAFRSLGKIGSSSISNILKYNRGQFKGELGGWYGSQSPYLIITRKKVVDMNYVNTIGKPCNKQLTLNVLSGFTIVKNPILSLSDANKNDIDEIKSLLSNGVIL